MHILRFFGFFWREEREEVFSFLLRFLFLVTYVVSMRVHIILMFYYIMYEVYFISYFLSGLVLSNTNKRAVLLIKLRAKWNYVLKKEQTWPQYLYHYFDEPSSFEGNLKLGIFLRLDICWKYHSFLHYGHRFGFYKGTWSIKYNFLW